MAPWPLPSFSKILLNSSAPHLPLPQAFVRKHLQNKIPENPILRSVNGGYSWRLEIKKLGENYCFVNGWDDVVEDSRLEYGDFLVFWLVDPSTFKLSIFSPSGCEKDFPVEYDDANEETEEESEWEEEDEDEEDYDDDSDKDEDECKDEEENVCDEDDDVGGFIDGDDGDFFFMIIICKYHMRLPGGFARLTGIDSERTIIMKNLDGNEWPMSLLKESRCYERYYLSAGWSEFRRVNELSEGDKCVFKFLRSDDKLCLVRVTKKRDPAKLPAVKVPATEVKKRNKDLPPVESKDNGKEMAKKKKMAMLRRLMF